MELGIYQAIEHTLVIYSIIAAAWVGALVADLVVNKPLGFSPAYIEFKRAHLYDINPVGTGSMLLAVVAGADRIFRRVSACWRRRCRRSWPSSARSPPRP